MKFVVAAALIAAFGGSAPLVVGQLDLPLTVGGMFTRVGTGIGCPSSSTENVVYWDSVQWVTGFNDVASCGGACSFLRSSDLVGFTQLEGTKCRCFFKNGQLPTQQEVDAVQEGGTIDSNTHSSTGTIVKLFDGNDSGTWAYCTDHHPYTYDGFNGGSVAALSLNNYKGDSVKFDSTCTADASSSGDKVTCSASWKNSDETVEADAFAATLKSSIVEGGCSDLANTDFAKTPASSNASKSGTTTVSTSVTVTNAEKGENGGVVTKNLCARADLFDDNENVSVIAAMADVEVEYTYAQDGTFSITNIGTEAFTADEATASDVRTVTLAAAQGTCAAPATSTVSTGDKLSVCVSSAETDIKVSGVNTVTVKSINAANEVVGTQTVVDAAGQSNFVTSVAQSGNMIELSTLVVPYYADQLNGAAGTLKIEGTGTIEYITTRRLRDGRTMQEVETVEDAPFSMEFPLGETEMPEIAQAEENSGSSVAAGLVASAAASVVAIYGMA